MNIVKPAKVCCARWGDGGGRVWGGGDRRGRVGGGGGGAQGAVSRGWSAGGRVAATVCARRSVVNDTATLHQRAKVTPPRAAAYPRPPALPPASSNASRKFLHFLATGRHIGSIILVASPASKSLFVFVVPCAIDCSCVSLWKLYYPPEKSH